MGLFNHFPYPDTHQLNLDWILETVKSCVDKVTELWTYVREPGAGIQKALTDAQAAATTAQTSAQSAQAAATETHDMINSFENDLQLAMQKIYPVGSVYVNYRNQAMPEESDATVIARLQALTGGTWARAGSHGQPVTASDKLGWATVMFGDGAGHANNTNFNIYVRTA